MSDIYEDCIIIRGEPHQLWCAAAQEGYVLDNTTAVLRLVSHAAAFFVQKDAAIGAAMHIPLCGKAGQHLGDNGLRGPKSRCDIDLTDLKPFGQQVDIFPVRKS